jgi:hypothetical protein
MCDFLNFRWNTLSDDCFLSKVTSLVWVQISRWMTSCL